MRFRDAFEAVTRGAPLEHEAIHAAATPHRAGDKQGRRFTAAADAAKIDAARFFADDMQQRRSERGRDGEDEARIVDAGGTDLALPLLQCPGYAVSGRRSRC